MSGLFDLAKSHFSPELVSRILPFLGLTSDQTDKAVEGAISTLGAGALERASQPGGAAELLELLQPYLGGKSDFSSIWSQEGGVIRLMEQGNGLFTGIFGNRTGEVANSLADSIGISEQEAGKLLRVVAPAVLSGVGAALGANASIESLKTFLLDQVSELSAKLPKGLPFNLGAIVATPGGEVTAVETPVAAVVKPTFNSSMRITVGDEPEVPATVTAEVATPKVTVPAVKTTVTSQTPVTPVVTSTKPVESGSGKGIVWGAIAAAVLAAGYFAFNALSSNSTESSINAPTVVGGAKPVAPVEPNLPDVEVVTKPGMVALTFGTANIQAMPEGVEKKLLDFIQSDKPVDKTTWFSFDRLYFDSAKATLKPESKDQLSNIVKILAEFPKVKLKIGGYTDNQGDDKMNLTLSNERANATMTALIELGVDKVRLEAEGYGEQFPVGNNETEEGRAQNRRIDVRVSEK